MKKRNLVLPRSATWLVVATCTLAVACRAPSPAESADAPALEKEAEQTSSQDQAPANLDPSAAPSENFKLAYWKLTLPDLDPARGKAREIKESELNGKYQNPDWFFTDSASGAMVFKTPNHLATTKNSKNTRSELREMVRAGNTDIGTKDPKNNWVIASHPQAATFGAVGGKLSAELTVDWVSTSGNDAKFAAHSVVVGQIHGSGKTEPLKIFYRKLPGHKLGSLFWNYEARPEDMDARFDISNDVFGSYQLTGEDAEPSDGIALGERFSYVVDISGDLMKLSFVKADGTEKSFEHDLSRGHPEHEIDRGYSDDWMYFKAGAYNQCNLGTEGVWGSACENGGPESGDYAQVSFFELSIEH